MWRLSYYVEDGRRRQKKKKGKNLAGRCKFLNTADESSEDSSDDDQGACKSTGDEAFAKYCGLSPKVRQINHHQGGAEFVMFFKHHAQ